MRLMSHWVDLMTMAMPAQFIYIYRYISICTQMADWAPLSHHTRTRALTPRKWNSSFCWRFFSLCLDPFKNITKLLLCLYRTWDRRMRIPESNKKQQQKKCQERGEKLPEKKLLTYEYTPKCASTIRCSNCVALVSLELFIWFLLFVFHFFFAFSFISSAPSFIIFIFFSSLSFIASFRRSVGRSSRRKKKPHKFNTTTSANTNRRRSRDI